MLMKLISGLFVLASCLLLSPLAPAQARHTNFDPARHGFNFHNDFENDVKLPAGMDVRTGGLCGGLALPPPGYFCGKPPVPAPNHSPARQTPPRALPVGR